MFSLSVVDNTDLLLFSSFVGVEGSQFANAASEVIAPSIIPAQKVLATFSYAEVLELVPHGVKKVMQAVVGGSRSSLHYRWSEHKDVPSFVERVEEVRRHRFGFPAKENC